MTGKQSSGENDFPCCRRGPRGKECQFWGRRTATSASDGLIREASIALMTRKESERCQSIRFDIVPMAGWFSSKAPKKFSGMDMFLHDVSKLNARGNQIFERSGAGGLSRGPQAARAYARTAEQERRPERQGKRHHRGSEKGCPIAFCPSQSSRFVHCIRGTVEIFDAHFFFTGSLQ